MSVAAMSCASIRPVLPFWRETAASTLHPLTALEVHFGLRALALPVLLAVLAIGLGELRSDSPAVHPDSNRRDV
jgi:membrane protein required for beta-lactamase induction